MPEQPTSSSPFAAIDAEAAATRRFRLRLCLPFVLAILVLAIISIVEPGTFYSLFHSRSLHKGETSISLGLDLKGGTRLTYRVLRDPHLSDTQFVQLLEETQRLLRDRIATFGNLEPNIWIDQAGFIFLELPGIEDRESIERLVGKTGRLDFVVLSPTAGRIRVGQKLTEADRLDTVATKEDVDTFKVKADARGEMVFLIEFKEDRAANIHNTLSTHKSKRIALVLSGEVRDVAQISDNYGTSGSHSRGCVISSEKGLSAEQTAAYEKLFRWDSLPLELEEQERRSIGPQTGIESLVALRVAAILGGVLIFVLMLVLYGTYLGGVACLALLYAAVLMWGVLSAMGTVLTMAGVAGLLLDVGVFVDSFIIIFEAIKERFKERRSKGLEPFDEETMWDSIQRSAKHLTSLRLTTALAASVMLLSPGPVRAFAISLIVGVIIETLIASRPVLGALLILFASQGRQDTHGWSVLGGERSQRGVRWALGRLPWVAAISGSLALGLLLFALVRPPPLGLEFGGGVQLRIDGPRDMNELSLRETLAAGGLTDLLSVQSVIPMAREKTRPWLVSFRSNSKDDRIESRVQAAFEERKITARISGAWRVAPGVPSKLLLRWLTFCLAALGAIVVWCAMPWSGVSVGKRRIGPALIVGIGALHDLCIILGIVAVLRLPVDTPMLMGGLFILSYAINDSLVLIWHLGEGAKGRSWMADPERRSVRDVIMGIRARTFNIFVLMFSALLPVLLLAGGSFRSYAAVVLTGLVVGSLTSVFVVGYLLDMLVGKTAALTPAAAKAEVIASQP